MTQQISALCAHIGHTLTPKEITETIRRYDAANEKNGWECRDAGKYSPG